MKRNKLTLSDEKNKPRSLTVSLAYKKLSMILLSSNCGSFMSLNKSDSTRRESFRSALITRLSLKKPCRSCNSRALNKLLAFCSWAMADLFVRTTVLFWAYSVTLALNLFCCWISCLVVGLMRAESLTYCSVGSNCPFKVPEYSLLSSVNHLKRIWFRLRSNSCTNISKVTGLSILILLSMRNCTTSCSYIEKYCVPTCTKIVAWKLSSGRPFGPYAYFASRIPCCLKK